MPPLKAAGQYDFFVLNSSGKGFQRVHLMGQQVSQIVYYEEHMLRRAAEQFGLKAEELTKRGAVFPLAEPKRAEAAELALDLLQTALAEHDSAIQRYQRRGPAWADLRRPLAEARLNLLISQIHELVRQQRHPEATALCDRLFAEPDMDTAAHQRVRELLELILLQPAEQAWNRWRWLCSPTRCSPLIARPRVSSIRRRESPTSRRPSTERGGS